MTFVSFFFFLISCHEKLGWIILVCGNETVRKITDLLQDFGTSYKVQGHFQGSSADHGSACEELYVKRLNITV